VSAAGALTAAGPVSGGDVRLSASALAVTAAGSVTAGNALALGAHAPTLPGTPSAGRTVPPTPPTAHPHLPPRGPGPAHAPAPARGGRSRSAGTRPWAARAGAPPWSWATAPWAGCPPAPCASAAPATPATSA